MSAADLPVPTARPGQVPYGAVDRDESAAPTVMSRVTADAPSAVLLVDLDRGEVTYANELARQLAPGLPLPVTVSDWSARAGLHDDEGVVLEATRTPLARVAAGDPVTGELVTAMRSSDVSAAREALWVVGTPMSEAPGPLGRQALVVLLPLRETEAVARVRAGAADLRHRAVVASQLAFSISDATAPDDPLVWVNPAFERTTGYAAADVVGQNCRLLQGPLTDTDTVTRIGERLRAGLLVNETLLNYRADGTAFWNHLVISPVFDSAGSLTHHVGVQTDVTERVDTERALQVAVERAEASSARQRAVAAIGAQLTSYLSSAADLLADLPSLVVSHFAGWCAVIAVANGAVSNVAVAADVDERELPFWRTEAELRTFLASREDQVLAALRDAGARWPLMLELDAPRLGASNGGGATGDRRFHVMFALMASRAGVSGLLALIRPEGGFDDPDEVAAIADLATRAAAAMENTRLYSAERDAALTLQRSLLPTLPALARFDIAASYFPAADATVGGDWFDVIDLPGPWIGAAVGDVIGHDMNAAAVMGQLRSMVRTLAWEGHEPAELVSRLDGLMRGFGTSSFATVLYALIDDPAEEDRDFGPRFVTYTSAGHLPALLRGPDGAVTRLDGARTSPVGIADEREVGQAKVELTPGSTLVLYTDGLIERRDRDLEDGFVALEEVLAALPVSSDAATSRDAIVEALVSPDHTDDTCVLIIRSVGSQR